MKKSKLGILIASSTLILGLTACNFGDGRDNKRSNILTRDNNNNNRIIDVRKNNDNDDLGRMDHRGPLTEEFDNNDRNFAYDYIGKRYHRDNQKNISDSFTDLSSRNYPHTRPILVQEAKYQFVRMDPRNMNFQTNFPQQFGGYFRDDMSNVPRQNQYITERNQQGQGMQPAPAPSPQRHATQAPTQPQPKATTPAPATKQPPTNTTATTNISQAARQVVDLTNAERRKNGLRDLQLDTQLAGVAQKKSVDMEQKHYFSHTSPTYGSPFDMMRDFGVSYKTAGENIAQGQRTPQEVVQAWMNSEGHRKNILSPNFTHIGVGFDQNGYYWSQMFIGK